MSIQGLLLKGLIEKAVPDRSAIGALLGSAESGIRDARSTVKNDPALGVSQIYDVVYAACRALMLSEGYRTVGETDYRAVLMFCHAALDPPYVETLDTLAAAERKRHDEMYDGCFSMDAREAGALLAKAARLIGHVKEKILNPKQTPNPNYKAQNP